MKIRTTGQRIDHSRKLEYISGSQARYLALRDLEREVRNSPDWLESHPLVSRGEELTSDLVARRVSPSLAHRWLPVGDSFLSL